MRVPLHYADCFFRRVFIYGLKHWNNLPLGEVGTTVSHWHELGLISQTVLIHLTATS